MFDTILVPLDGSQLSECVLPHMLAFAKVFNAEVTLLRVLEKNQTGVSAQLFDLVNWQINKTRSMLYLERTRSNFQELSRKTQTAVIEGLVAESITEYVQNHGMKLVVLSSHGRNGLTQWGISSITQKIILGIKTSLLIARAHQQDFHAAQPYRVLAYRRILLPLDGSQRAENVLPAITKLAQFHNSRIHLVQVIQSPEMARQMPPTPEDMDLSNRVVRRNQEEAGRYLDQVKSRSILEGVAVQTHLITSDNAAVSLHRLVEQEQIDLVGLSAHGYSGNHLWPYGNMVNNFILYGRVPLLVVQDLPVKQESAPAPELPAAERIER
jgi:nucleotide-binding universal stress UspA family protein